MPELTLLALGSREPIHLQIAAQFERLISAGAYAAGDDIPSVRDLAERWQVNPMTVSKAFGLLEQQGLITHRRGKPMAVAPQHQKPLAMHARLKLLDPMLVRVVEEAKQLGLPPDLVLEQLAALLAKSAAR